MKPNFLIILETNIEHVLPTIWYKDSLWLLLLIWIACDRAGLCDEESPLKQTEI